MPAAFVIYCCGNDVTKSGNSAQTSTTPRRSPSAPTPLVPLARAAHQIRRQCSQPSACKLALPTFERSVSAALTSPSQLSASVRVIGVPVSSEEPEEVSRLLGERSRDHLEAQAKTSIFKLTYSDGSEIKMFLLPEGETLAGRSQTCNLVIKDPSASRRHARFEVKEGRCFVEDLGSRAGTCKNGEFITRAELRDGDVVSLGQMQL